MRLRMSLRNIMIRLREGSMAMQTLLKAMGLTIWAFIGIVVVSSVAIVGYRVSLLPRDTRSFDGLRAIPEMHSESSAGVAPASAARASAKGAAARGTRLNNPARGTPSVPALAGDASAGGDATRNSPTAASTVGEPAASRSSGAATPDRDAVDGSIRALEEQIRAAPTPEHWRLLEVLLLDQIATAGNEPDAPVFRERSELMIYRVMFLTQTLDGGNDDIAMANLLRGEGAPDEARALLRRSE